MQGLVGNAERGCHARPIQTGERSSKQWVSIRSNHPSQRHVGFSQQSTRRRTGSLAATLLAEGTLQPQVVLTDLESMLHVRPHTKLPVALVVRRDTPPTASSFYVGTACVSPPSDHPEHASQLRAAIETLVASVDLCEPFERIRAAIEEAQRH